jgi:quinol monooxygenase YgiN
MIIVTGAVTARPDRFEDLLEACLAHVTRSRTEAGCVSHSVHIDAENPLRLFFYEQWESMEALKTHFRQPDANAFMIAMRELTSGQEKMQIRAVADAVGEQAQ